MLILGAWRALKTTSISSDGTDVIAPFGGEHAVGSISFEPNGWMTTILCDGRTANELNGPRQFHAYAGTYDFDGQRLLVNVEVATNQNLIGSQQVREVSFDREFMVLTPPAQKLEGRTIMNRVYWRRLVDKHS
jgi:hypothetical protein